MKTLPHSYTYTIPSLLLLLFPISLSPAHSRKSQHSIHTEIDFFVAVVCQRNCGAKRKPPFVTSSAGERKERERKREIRQQKPEIHRTDATGNAKWEDEMRLM